MRALIFTALCLIATALSAEVYRWTDANGNTVYGDNPPESVKAKEVELPTLTVADSFLKEDKKKPAASADASTSNPDDAKAYTPEEGDDASKQGYQRFVVVAPDIDEVVRSNTGDITVRVELKPALKEGHGLVIYLDGKQVAKGNAMSIPVSGVERGEHSVFALVHNQDKTVLGNSEAVNFTVVKASIMR